MTWHALQKAARLARSLDPLRAAPEDVWASGWLLLSEWRLYLAMDPRDRAHAVRVAQALLRAYPSARGELVAAALLHEVGKAGRVYRVWERVLVGLVPLGLIPWGPLGRWQPLRLRLQHPALGAAAILAAGGRSAVARLVAAHHHPGLDPEAELLYRFDHSE